MYNPFRFFLSLLVFALVPSSAFGQFFTVKEERSYADPPTGDWVTNGVITPMDQKMVNFYVRNADGAIEVQLQENVQIGLQSRVQRGGFETRRVEFKMGDKQFSYDLPQNLYVKRTFKDAEAIRQWEERGRRPIMDGKLYIAPIPDQLPTLEKPWISGRFIRENGRFMDVQIGNEVFQIGTQGHDGQHRIMGLLSRKDIKPFVQQAFVHGEMKGNVFNASEVCLRMLEDSKNQDDPNLGRYLFIGDSISGNYDKALRTALMGKLNIYHPPTNCGPVRKGAENIVQWLGAYEQPGLGWDVISFNFGQWDSSNTRARYQEDLEKVISELNKTGAKLIFVTTTPIPGGYPRPGELGPDNKATGRVQKTMERFINPWALEVMSRHPEIEICDQHALISHEKFYSTWLKKAGFHKKGQNNPYGDLHIGGLLAEPVGRQLARKVLDVLGRAGEALSPHELGDHELDPNRQRPATRDMVVKDFIDLLTNDQRLRKY
jgi:hypothetical protein